MLDTTKEYKATATFNVSNVKLIVKVKNEDGDTLDGAEYKIYSDEELNNEISEGLNFDVSPSKTYYLKAVKDPDGYELPTSIIPVVISDNGIATANNYDITTNEGINTLTIIVTKETDTTETTETTESTTTTDTTSTTETTNTTDTTDSTETANNKTDNKTTNKTNSNENKGIINSLLPKTGDDIIKYVITFIISITVIAGIIILKRKNNDNNKE